MEIVTDLVTMASQLLSIFVAVVGVSIIADYVGRRH